MKKLISFILLCMLFLGFPSATAYEVSSTSGTSDGGSTFHYNLVINSETSELTREMKYTFQIVLVVDNFASNVKDFHDIELFVKGESGSSLIFEGQSSGLGTIDKEASSYWFNLDITPNNAFPDSFDVSVSSIFREDVSFSTDPETNDVWIVMDLISLIDPIQTTTLIVDDAAPPGVINEGFLTSINLFYFAILGLLVILPIRARK